MTIGAFLHPFAAVGRARESMTEIVRGEGACVFDSAGNRYLDTMAGLWFAQIGFGRPEMGDAIASAASRLGAFHTFERYTNPDAEELAEQIAARAPQTGSRVFFTTSGSEAVEAAVKLARLAQIRAGHPERGVVISRNRAYHGVTLAGTTAAGISHNRDGFGPLAADFVRVDADDAASFSGVCEQHAGRIAAIITEPVQGAGGVFPPSPGYLGELRRLADEHGAYLILDEVITGFGRLGHWFGSTHFDVRPDLTAFAKGVSSGYVPLGGVVVGPAPLAPLSADPDFVLRHGHTYSGHQVAMAAGLTNMRILETEDLLERALHIGGLISAGLGTLVDHDLGTEVRGVGAVWAVQLPAGVDAVAARDATERRGVITRPLSGSLCLCPPLVITDSEVDEAISAMRDGIRESMT